MSKHCCQTEFQGAVQYNLTRHCAVQISAQKERCYIKPMEAVHAKMETSSTQTKLWTLEHRHFPAFLHDVPKPIAKHGKMEVWNSVF